MISLIAIQITCNSDCFHRKKKKKKKERKKKKKKRRDNLEYKANMTKQVDPTISINVESF